MKKFLRYTLKAFVILLSILAIMIAGVFIYVSYNKDDIINKAKSEISAKLNGDVQIGNIDLSFFRNFPNVSVLLENVSITDTMFNVHKHPFFHAEKVYAVIGIGNTIRRNNPLAGIRIDNGELYVYTDTAGYTNAYLFSPKRNNDTIAKTASAKTEIESIKLRNVRLILDDHFKNKLYDFEVHKMNCKIKTSDTVFSIKMDDNIMIHSLAFNTLRGSYVKETSFESDFVFEFNKNKKQLSFQDIEVLLKKHKFILSGAFNFTDSPTFSLKVFSKNIDFSLAKSLLTPKIATAISIVQLNEPIKEVSADINGPLKGGEPLVKASWKIEQTDVASPFLSLSACSLSGSYINEIITGVPRTDPNSRLHFENVTGTYGGIHVACKEAFIDNLVLPQLRCDVKANFELSQLNELLASNSIRLNGGKGSLDLTYSGPLQQNNNQNSLLNGKLSISDGMLTYLPRNIQAKNVSGNVLFKNTDVFVTDFAGNVLGSKIKMNGSGKNLLALIATNPGRLFIEWNIYTPSLNLNNFTSLLKTKAAVSGSSTKKSKLGSTAKQLDLIVDYSNFVIKLKADELLYSKFKATNVKAIMSLKNEDWALDKVTLEHAGGDMSLNGYLTEKNAQIYEANIKVNMNNVDVNRVMYAFDNFGQKGIEADNLKGKLTTFADVKLNINRTTEQPSDIDGYVDFSLKNGALLHYEPLKQVQTIIFKKRNFDEIYFAELKDRLQIKDREITINRMEIQSTALSLFIEGVYSLKGNTDLSIQVPISNLKKRDENYKPENKGTDHGGGASIYLRGQTGKDGAVGFKLDVFKKLRKKKTD